MPPPPYLQQQLMLLFHLTSIEKFNPLKVIIAFKSSNIVGASYGPTVLHSVRAILLVGKYTDQQFCTVYVQYCWLVYLPTNLKSRHQ